MMATSTPPQERNTNMTIIGLTGMRPAKLPCGYDKNHECYLYIKQSLTELYKKYEVNKIVSGMAQGFDQAGVEVAIEMNIPFVAAVPFEGQESSWPAESQSYYNSLLSKSVELYVISDGGFANWKYQKRNEYIVNTSNMIISCWDGSNGGTKNCITYAKSKQINIININPIKMLIEEL